jgi:lysophospholipase L1-like esterase
MKRSVVIAILFGTSLVQLMAVINPNPIISRGKTVYTSNGSVTYLNDNKFNTTSFNVTNNSWIAINIGTGYSSIFFNWNNPVYDWAQELIPANCAKSMSFIVDYDLLVSSNSTNGSDGDWTTADSIRGNIVTARGHMIDFSGASWIKMKIIKGIGNIDEVEVFNTSSGNEDIWFFAGTSISANTFKGTPPAVNFADAITKNHPDHNPVMIRGGIGCISSSDLINNLSKYLKMAGNAHFWAIEMGTNDAWGGTNGNVALFKSNLQRVIDSCKKYNIRPVIAKVIATNPTAAQWQVHPDFQKAIEELTAANGLIQGPDFFAWFSTHPGDLLTDGVHPSATGAASIQRLWTQKMDSLYGGCSAMDIVPYIKVNSGSLTLYAAASPTIGDTLILSPQIADTGTWSWTGPASFVSATREITITNIQKTQAGTYNVVFTDTGKCVSTNSFKITVKNPVVKVSSMNSKYDINIFPNPSKDGSFTIALKTVLPDSQVQIYDVQGKLIYFCEISEPVTRVNIALTKGLYFVRVANYENCFDQKLVIE